MAAATRWRFATRSPLRRRFSGYAETGAASRKRSTSFARSAAVGYRSSGRGDIAFRAIARSGAGAPGGNSDCSNAPRENTSARAAALARRRRGGSRSVQPEQGSRFLAELALRGRAFPEQIEQDLAQLPARPGKSIRDVGGGDAEAALQVGVGRALRSLPQVVGLQQRELLRLALARAAVAQDRKSV